MTYYIAKMVKTTLTGNLSFLLISKSLIFSYMAGTSGHRNSYLRLPDFSSKKAITEA
jgi:5-bromo-4-chloroindolyl phosphate hydrolysis protein